ncbi:MAG TPA: hypothetical protein VFJ13_10850, partial [Paracoccaceae bacterium]|nr:hypothetical protein [Paracoccaceae bacterium]
MDDRGSGQTESGQTEHKEDPEPPPAPEAQEKPSAPEVQENPSLLGRLLGWSSNGDGDDRPARGRAALGPAFGGSSPAELAMVANIL